MPEPVTHSPTPWAVRADEPYVPEVGGAVYIDAPAWRGVAKVYLHCTGPDEGNANAAFIVKAVNCHAELLAALIEARRYVACGVAHSTKTTAEGRKQAGEVYGRIDALLSKAKGN